MLQAIIVGLKLGRTEHRQQVDLDGLLGLRDCLVVVLLLYLVVGPFSRPVGGLDRIQVGGERVGGTMVVVAGSIVVSIVACIVVARSSVAGFVVLMVPDVVEVHGVVQALVVVQTILNTKVF